MIVSEQHRYSIRVLLICLFGWTIANMDQSFFGYAIPAIMAEFDVDLVFIGLILTVAFLISVEKHYLQSACRLLPPLWASIV
jgi:hypothetical protein